MSNRVKVSIELNIRCILLKQTRGKIRYRNVGSLERFGAFFSEFRPTCVYTRRPDHTVYYINLFFGTTFDVDDTAHRCVGVCAHSPGNYTSRE